MSSPEINIRWEVLTDAAAVATEAARRVADAAAAVLAAGNRFSVVLAGGTTPEQTYRQLRETDTDWAAWQIYFGDERCLPEGHPDRNSTMAEAAWLAHVAIPTSDIHRIPAAEGPERAARRYAAVVAEATPFDCVLLGLGEDGHTASLFPGIEQPPTGLAHAVFGAPKPPPERVTLSAEALSAASMVLVLVTGAGKQDALRAWRAGAPLPIATIRPRHGLDVLLDASAAEALG